MRVQRVDGPNHLGELVVAAGELHRLLRSRVRGEAGRAQAQHGQRAGERTGHRHRDADRDQQQGADEGDPDLQCGDVVVPQPLQVLGAVVVERGLGAAHQLDAGGERRVHLVRTGAELGVGERRLVGEFGEVLVRGRDVRSGDRGVVGVLGVLGGRLAEVREGRVRAEPGLLGGGAERVAPLGVGRGRAAGGGRQAGERADDRLGGARDVEGREEQSAGGGGLLDRGVQLGEGVRAGARAGRQLLGQVLGERVEFGDDVGVRLMRFESGALTGERRSAGGADAVQVLQEDGGRVLVRPHLVDLPVDPGAALLGGRHGLRPARGDVRGDLVALVGQRVGERQRLLGPPGERHQVLGVVQLLGGRQDRGGSGAGDGGRDDRHGDDQPIAHMGGAALARGGLPRGTRRALRTPSEADCPAPEVDCLPARRDRIICTGARIPDSCTQGPG